jgi:hypothetical protein
MTGFGMRRSGWEALYFDITRPPKHFYPLQSLYPLSPQQIHHATVIFTMPPSLLTTKNLFASSARTLSVRPMY